MPFTTLVHYETDNETVIQGFTVSEILVDMQTNFQRVRIYKTPAFGKVLVLDDETQSAQSDEYIYHESLVHPAMGTCYNQPKNVCIIGAGENSTSREVLRWATVENVIMLDIDGKLMELCKTHLPEWSTASDGTSVWSDPRLHVYAVDAFTWLETHTDIKFDVIIMDLCDPRPSDESDQINRFYTTEFIETIKTQHLSPYGVFVAQVGDYTSMSSPYQTIATVFGEAHVHAYTTYIPSFSSMWGFVIAYSGYKYEHGITHLAKLPFNLKYINDTRLNSIMTHNFMKFAGYNLLS